MIKNITRSKWTLVIAALFSVFFVSCGKDTVDPNTAAYGDDEQLMTFRLAGGTIASTNTTTPQSKVEASYNALHNLLTYTITYKNLSGAPMSGGIYNDYDPANIITIGTFAPGSFVAGSTPGSGTYTGSMKITDEQARFLLGSTWYYELNTAGSSPEVSEYFSR